MRKFNVKSMSSLVSYKALNWLGAALAYFGKTQCYDLCLEYDNCEHISNKCNQICKRGEDTEDLRSVLPVWTYGTIGVCGSLGGPVDYMLRNGNTP